MPPFMHGAFDFLQDGDLRPVLWSHRWRATSRNAVINAIAAHAPGWCYANFWPDSTVGCRCVAQTRG